MIKRRGVDLNSPLPIATTSYAYWNTRARRHDHLRAALKQLDWADSRKRVVCAREEFMRMDRHSPWWALLAVLAAVALPPACKQYRVADTDGSADSADAQCRRPEAW